jgi:hypothetical protein
MIMDGPFIGTGLGLVGSKSALLVWTLKKTPLSNAPAITQGLIKVPMIMLPVIKPPQLSFVLEHAKSAAIHRGNMVGPQEPQEPQGMQKTSHCLYTAHIRCSFKDNRGATGHNFMTGRDLS